MRSPDTEVLELREGDVARSMPFSVEIGLAFEDGAVERLGELSGHASSSRDRLRGEGGARATSKIESAIFQAILELGLAEHPIHGVFSGDQSVKVMFFNF